MGYEKYLDIYSRICNWVREGDLPIVELKDDGFYTEVFKAENSAHELLKAVISTDFTNMVTQINTGKYDWIQSSHGLSLFKAALIRRKYGVK